MNQGQKTLKLLRDPKHSAGSKFSGEPIDFTAFFRRFAPYVATIGFRVLGRDEEVDDLVQDVFLQAGRKLGTVREPEAIKGWLATITVRQARRRLRMRRLRIFLHLEDERSYGTLLVSTASQERRVLIAQVYSLLDAMPVNERLAWVLRHLEGHTLEEVAKHCGCSLATAKRRINAVRRRIEEALGE